MKETREPIGEGEATTLLRFKVQRGGEERLTTIQNTVKALLGVKVNVYESEDSSEKQRRAEIDIDDFLIEVNGAGVREALRLVLDLELKKPDLALIEEPEVHLHPGLSQVVAGYLRQKSRTVQMFAATQSTEFVDTLTFQNAYLVSRDSTNKTISQVVSADEAALRIPAELGLRLSAVFMFDRLVFVEGPIDESVLREIANVLNLDLTKTNVGFVHVGGVRNFAHFAAEGTLDLLSRRKIRMWFICDRDEKDDSEVAKMIARLGERAKLMVLRRRELENYLSEDLKPLCKFIVEKRLAAGLENTLVEEKVLRATTEEEIEGLRQEVVRLRLEKRLLTPIFLQVRSLKGGIEERLSAAICEATSRKERLKQEEASITKEVQDANRDVLRNIVPGSMLLKKICERFGVSFVKENGDSERLAQLMRADLVPQELRELMLDICAEKMES